MVYYFDPEGNIVEETTPGGRIEVVYWADDNLTNMVGSMHGNIPA